MQSGSSYSWSKVSKIDPIGHLLPISTYLVKTGTQDSDPFTIGLWIGHIKQIGQARFPIAEANIQIDLSYIKSKEEGPKGYRLHIVLQILQGSI